MVVASISELFDLSGRVAVVTGGSGVLGGAIAAGLLAAGARVCIISSNIAKVQSAVQALAQPHRADRVMGLRADVTQPDDVEAAAQAVLQRWGTVDVLVNAAGGTRPDALTGPQRSLFDLSLDVVRAVVDLNFYGTWIPSVRFARAMAERGSGSIINISSMTVQRAMTRTPAYSAGKAAMENFTRWLAVHMAKEISPHIRVNAIAPGFFLGEQNRALLIDPHTGQPTPRGQAILSHTPMGRFGEAEELIGAAVWLASDASRFVTGAVIPVDGGFSAFSGV